MTARASTNGRRPLPTYLPLKQAARLSGLSVTALQKRIELGTITAIGLPNGEIAVSEQDARASIPKEELAEYKKHAHLRGVKISISDAADRYGVSTPTISRWVKHGYIQKLGTEGLKVLIDEQDIAYCADVYHRRGGQGRWLFNADGTPYKPKTDSLSGL